MQGKGRSTVAAVGGNKLAPDAGPPPSSRKLKTKSRSAGRKDSIFGVLRKSLS